MRRLILSVFVWFEARLGLRETLKPLLQHPIPRGAAGPEGWWYVFGSAALTMLLIQIVTGIGLALVYVPSAASAYETLLYLNYEQPLGWFLRALHYWAGSAMMLLVFLHMAQVFLHGAYKYPRELTWVVGVFLLVLTLGMFFSGQVLRWDTDAYWGVSVGAAMAGRVPGFGPQAVTLLLGGPTIGADTLSRFFTLHVFVIPGLLLLTLGLHLYLVIRRGISEPPVAGELVDPATYDAKYEKELEQGEPLIGPALLRDITFSGIAVALVVLLCVLVGPKGPSDPPDPALGGANPRPDWPFLWLFALLSLSPPAAETAIILFLPPVLVLILLAVPFFSNRGERAPSRRPGAVLLVVMLATLFGVLTWLGHSAPWSPIMNAWKSDPIPVGMVKHASPLQLQGALLFQNKNCRNCHALGGVGGTRGPDLSLVGSRLTRDLLIDQISNGTPGGGNMPAYGKNINPVEMTALIEFLVGLRPPGVPPAKPSAVSGPAGRTASR